MVKRGFEISKKHLEHNYKAGKIDKKTLCESIKQLRKNYQDGTARREMDSAGIKNYMEY